MLAEDVCGAIFDAMQDVIEKTIDKPVHEQIEDWRSLIKLAPLPHDECWIEHSLMVEFGRRGRIIDYENQRLVTADESPGHLLHWGDGLCAYAIFSTAEKPTDTAAIRDNKRQIRSKWPQVTHMLSIFTTGSDGVTEAIFGFGLVNGVLDYASIMLDNGMNRTRPVSGAPDVKMDLHDELVQAADHWRNLIFICATLAAPGMTKTLQQRKMRCLQKVSATRVPILKYTVVDFNLAQERAANINDGPGGMTARARHRVRGHLRLLEKGFVPVRPHWRGTQTAGSVIHDYIVRDD